MNEYRVPELNVQNGVLKALSFLFEYIGEMGKDYIYAVTPLFEDALQERDLVHRQVKSNASKKYIKMPIGIHRSRVTPSAILCLFETRRTLFHRL